jgi:hypothetical protein
MSKEQKVKAENAKPAMAADSTLTDVVNTCKEYNKLTNAILEERNKLKVNSLSHCDEKDKGCGCSGHDSGNPAGQKTDLIVLIDTSGSMGGAAALVSDAVKAAIAEAKKACDPDLEITFLGVDGTWTGTAFTQSHRDYITGIHGAVTLSADLNHVGYKPEQGANAIEDLSKYAKWREDACRAIFYISDEELDSIDPRNDFVNETAVTNAAIISAVANNVTVFAHHLTYQHLAPQIIQNYKDLCYNTGGDVYFSDAANKDEYVKLLSEVICNSCGKDTCTELTFPEIKPCISIKWGDSKCDCIESSDYEIMTLTVCNCYTNIKFSNFVISMLEVLDADGKPVPTLPNGTPSVKIHPIGIYCFGNIEPCSCVSREFVIINEGAKEGKYRIVLKGVCFDIIRSYTDDKSCFSFTICKD